jgi:hypothetical protein
MWIIYLGSYGSVGLACWSITLLLPSWIFVLRFPAHRWAQPDVAPLTIIATLLGIYTVDCLLNGFMNLAYITALGGLANAAWSINPAATAKGANRRVERPHLTVDRQDRANSSCARIDAAAPGSSPPDPRGLLADRYRSLARTLKGQQADRAAAESALTHAYDILTELASARPDDPEAQRQRRDCGDELAWLLAGENATPGTDPAMALELARRATQGDPGRANYWTTLGAACCRAGEPHAAIASLERSIALRDGSGTAHDYAFLALAHAQLGDAEAARRFRDRSGLQASGRDRQSDLIATIDDHIKSLSI